MNCIPIEVGHKHLFGCRVCTTSILSFGTEMWPLHILDAFALVLQPGLSQEEPQGRTNKFLLKKYRSLIETTTTETDSQVIKIN